MDEAVTEPSPMAKARKRKRPRAQSARARSAVRDDGDRDDRGRRDRARRLRLNPPSTSGTSERHRRTNMARFFRRKQVLPLHGRRRRSRSTTRISPRSRATSPRPARSFRAASRAPSRTTSASSRSPSSARVTSRCCRTPTSIDNDRAGAATHSRMRVETWTSFCSKRSPTSATSAIA